MRLKELASLVELLEAQPLPPPTWEWKDCIVAGEGGNLDSIPLERCRNADRVLLSIFLPSSSLLDVTTCKCRAQAFKPMCIPSSLTSPLSWLRFLKPCRELSSTLPVTFPPPVIQTVAKSCVFLFCSVSGIDHFLSILKFKHLLPLTWNIAVNFYLVHPAPAFISPPINTVCLTLQLSQRPYGCIILLLKKNFNGCSQASISNK